MLFNSFIFLFFLVTVIPIYYVLKTKSSRNTWLLITSYIFYGYWDWRFCSLLLISTFIDYYIALQLGKTEDAHKRKLLLGISLISNFTILGFFKYFNFFIDSFQTLLQTLNSNLNLDYLHLNLILPVGISFYTFQTVSYTIDVYRRELPPSQSLLDFAVYVSFFPQLVAGPIERATNLLPQIERINHATRQQFIDGSILIIYGLFKKVLIGDASGRYVDHIFSHMEYYSSWEIVFALLMFSIQIYADFSGYSNIARGTSKLLGIELIKNFEQPYLSRNITEFWRRWHISLSTWLKDYLYFSLGGNRRGKKRTYLNLMITMLLGGLWHGANWTFVIWGALHGFYLAAHKYFSEGKKITAENQQIQSAAEFLKFTSSVVFTYVLVVITWLFFRAKNLHEISQFINACLHWTWGNYPFRFLSILVGFTSITLLFDALEYRTKNHAFLNQIKSRPLMYAILSVMLASVMIYMINSKPLPFIYFQF